LKGLSTHRRHQLLDRACIDTLTSYRDLKNNIQLLGNLLQASNSPDTSNVQLVGHVYDLDAMRLSHLRAHLDKGHHLTPDAAFGAMLPHLHLTESMAILDSGATKHFVTPHFRPLLQSKRRIQCCMVNANGQTTSLSEGGDLSIDLHNATGKHIGTLLLLNLDY